MEVIGTSPICPACGDEMDADDMLAHESDLFALAPREEEEDIECRSCGVQYRCSGGYIPQYRCTLIDEEDA
jgi:hypothetical protein